MRLEGGHRVWLLGQVLKGPSYEVRLFSANHGCHVFLDAAIVNGVPLQGPLTKM